MDVVTQNTAHTATKKFLDEGLMYKTLLYVVKGTETNQPRLIQRALRQNVSLRKYITAIQVCVVRNCYEFHGVGRIIKWKVPFISSVRAMCGCLQGSSSPSFLLFLHFSCVSRPNPTPRRAFYPTHNTSNICCTLPFQLEALIGRYFPVGHVGSVTFAPYVAKIKEHEGKFASI